MSTLCRLCALPTTLTVSLLGEDVNKMLHSITAIKVDELDTLPSATCTSCLLDLEKAYSTQQRILKANRTLKAKQLKEESQNEEILHIEIVANDEVAETYDNLIIEVKEEDEETIAEGCVETNENEDIKKIEKHEPSEMYKCETCHKSFADIKKLKSHETIHATHLKCEICNLIITRKHFKTHVTNHSTGPQICDICGSVLASKASLQGHKFHKHNTEQYKCDQCPAVYKKRYTLQVHKKKHDNLKEKVCELCGKKFITNYHLNYHVRNTHLKLNTFECESCKKVFSSRHSLKTHQRQHTNEKPFKCDLCGEGFRQKVSLRTHRKSKHAIVEETPVQCKFCAKRFADLHALHSHMRLHNG